MWQLLMNMSDCHTLIFCYAQARHAGTLRVLRAGASLASRQSGTKQALGQVGCVHMGYIEYYASFA